MTPIQTKEGEVPVGFAGMSSMVSDVEALLAAARRQATAAVPQPPVDSAVPPAPRVEPPARKPLQSTSSFWRFSHAWWLGGLGLFVFGSMLLSESTKPAASIPASSQATRTATSLVPSRPTPEELPQPFKEEKPPVGKDHVLTRTQIQYCLAENIRLEAGQQLIHDTDDFRAVQQFNNLIDDYNSRCAEFRYQRSAMEAAKETVERQRPTIQAEGVGRFPTVGPETRPSSSHEADEKRTEESHLRLDSPLGTPTKLENDGVLDRADPRPAESDRFDAETESEQPTPSPRLVSRPSDASAKPGLVPGDPEAAPNLEQCLDGRYPALCKHEWLTPSQLEQVAVAERAANLKQCLAGDYPFLCDHTWLTPAQARDVEQAERRAMFTVCMEGRYPALCNESLLTSAQQQALRTARASAEQGASRN